MLFTIVDLTSALEELGLAKFHSRAIGSLPSPTALTPEMVLAALIAAKMPYDQMSRVIPHMLQGRTGGSPRSDSSPTLSPVGSNSSSASEFETIATLPSPSTTAPDPDASFTGAFVSSIDLPEATSNFGLAVSNDGTVAAVSNSKTNAVYILSLSGGSLIRTLGGECLKSSPAPPSPIFKAEGGIALVSLCAAPSTPDQLFQRPRHLCFSPPAYSSPSSLRLLVAEDGARRVQEVSVEGGEHIRYIGKGIIDGSIDGVCADNEHVVVGKARCLLGRQVFVFGYTSGEFLRSFGVDGPQPGRLRGCGGLRMMQPTSVASGAGVCDTRARVLITESWNDRVSIFTLAGDHVTSFGKGVLSAPSDAEVAPNADVIALDTDGCRVVVFPHINPSTPARTFGGRGSGPGQFVRPTALALCGERLLVLDGEGGRIQVFA